MNFVRSEKATFALYLILTFSALFQNQKEPQLGAVPFEPHMTRIVQEAAKSLLHPSVAGIVIPTSPELEPGVDKILAEAIGGECLQVGYVSC